MKAHITKDHYNQNIFSRYILQYTMILLSDLIGQIVRMKPILSGSLMRPYAEKWSFSARCIAT